MLLKKTGLLIAFFTLIGFQLFAQQPSKEELNKQRMQLQKEIEQLNQSLREIGNNKKKALDILRIINSKVEARENLIRNINKDIKRLDEDMFVKEREIYRLKIELDTLKIKYTKSIVFAYKNRSNYQYLNFLFSANDFNDALKRVTYLKSYRSLRETEVQNIVKTQSLLQTNVVQLGENKIEKTGALSNQSEQLKKFEDEKKEKDASLNLIKGQEKEITAQLRKREKQRQELNNAINAAIRREAIEAEKKERDRIARLKVEQEAKRKVLEAEALAAKLAAAKAKADAEAKNKADAKEKAAADALAKKREEESKKADEKVKAITYGPGSVLSPGKPVIMPSGEKREYSVFEGSTQGLQLSLDFEKNKGNLPWPVNMGDVCGKFGIVRLSPTLTEQHDGVIICLPIGTQVKGVADGEVTLIQNLDEYKSVIVRHGKYLTVYNRLSEVFVTKGQKVNMGTLIGKSAQGDRGDGEFEFRVMNGNKDYVNPENWLRRR